MQRRPGARRATSAPGTPDAGVNAVRRILPGMSERISRDDVAHVAHLARLHLSEEEIDAFTAQLAAVLEHAADIEALDVSGIPETAHPLPLVNVLRRDAVTPSLDRDEVLRQAPAAEDGLFRVPPILGEAP